MSQSEIFSFILAHSCILKNINKLRILHVSPAKVNFIPAVPINSKVKEGRKKKHFYTMKHSY